jgi:hypothetical protein
MGRDT